MAEAAACGSILSILAWPLNFMSLYIPCIGSTAGTGITCGAANGCNLCNAAAAPLCAFYPYNLFCGVQESENESILNDEHSFKGLRMVNSERELD